MTAFKVEKGVPIPVRRWAKKGYVEALRQLKEAGDSVWLPMAVSVTGNAARIAGLTGKYTARREEKDGVQGLRIWRTKK